MRHARTRRLLVTAMVAAVAATGCGTQDDGTSASTSGTAGVTEVAAAPVDSAPEEVTVVHAQGETVVPVHPETVVVFDLGVLDTLHQLGVQVAGVPALEQAALPDRFAAYAGDEYVKVGTLFEPDLEAVNALQPDLIIVGGRSSPVYGDLAALAPTIDLTVDGDDHLSSAAERIRALGPIFGVQEQIEHRLDELQDSVDRVQELAADAGTGLIVLTSGGEVSAYGPGSRFGLLHDVLGVVPAVEDVEDATHGDAISFEFILEADPDHLYVLDRDSTIGESGAAAAQVLDNELVHQTSAWQQGNVHHLDGVSWYLAPNGLGSLEAMVDEVETSLS